MISRFNFGLLIIGVALCTWTVARHTVRFDQDPAVAEFSMDEIPHPNLERLGALSQTQINAARSQCELLLTNPKSTDPLLRARAVAELGKYYFAYNFFDSAAVCFQFAQQWQPTEFRWPYLLGQTHRMNGQMDRAAQSIERALAIVVLDMSVSQDQGVAMLTWLGDIYLGDNQIDRAESCFRRALEEDSDSGTALMKMGQIAAGRGDHKQAIALFQRVLEATPGARNVLLLLAAEYRKNGETARAEQTLQRAEQLSAPQLIPRRDPLMAAVNQLDKSHQRFNGAGNRAFGAGRLQQALRLYEQGLEIAPDDINLLINIGSVWGRLGDYQRAREFWLRALEVEPNDNALAMLGQSHLRGGEHDLALTYLRQALEMKPNDPHYRFLLASAHSHAGGLEDALQAFRDVLAADPSHPNASLGEIRMLAALGRYDGALSSAERCCRELPEFPGATLAAARILSACPDHQLRDGPRALKLARAIYEEKKTVVAAETVAMAYAEAGDFPQAIEAQQWALQRLAPTNLETAKAQMQKRLKMYENQQACRQPWSPDDAFPAITRPLDVRDDSATDDLLGEDADPIELEVAD